MARIGTVDKMIGAKITSVRQKRSLSMKEAAKMINVSHQQFNKYEKGINRISASKLFILSKNMGIDISSFFNIEYYELNNDSKTIEDLVSDFLKLKSDKKKEIVLNLLKELLQK